MSKTKKIFGVILSVIVLSGFLFLNPAGAAISFINPIRFKTFGELIGAIINFIFNIALVIAPIMFIISGFYFITAAGDPAKIKTAKDIIWYAVIGLVVVLLAKGLIQVLEQVIGVKIGR